MSDTPTEILYPLLIFIGVTLIWYAIEKYITNRKNSKKHGSNTFKT